MGFLDPCFLHTNPGLRIKSAVAAAPSVVFAGFWFDTGGAHPTISIFQFTI